MISDVRSGIEKQQFVVKSNFVYALIHFMHQVNHNLLLMQSLFSRIPHGMTAKHHVLKTQDRIRTDIDVIKRSIKAGLSVILALGFWLVSNWSGGLNGIISSLVLSIRKHLFEMKSVSIHRLLGCIWGGGIALFSLFLIKMTLYDFILIFFFQFGDFLILCLSCPNIRILGYRQILL